ncbi:MAG: hypothetical protein WA086_14750 [Ideonella sp.]
MDWGTDVTAQSYNPPGVRRAVDPWVTLRQWLTPAEVLKLVTRDNAELLALSGPRNPCPGKLGVVEPGAHADLLLVDGDPLAQLELLADPARNLMVIVKDGVVAKNQLH